MIFFATIYVDSHVEGMGMNKNWVAKDEEKSLGWIKQMPTRQLHFIIKITFASLHIYGRPKNIRTICILALYNIIHYCQEGIE